VLATKFGGVNNWIQKLIEDRQNQHVNHLNNICQLEVNRWRDFHIIIIHTMIRRLLVYLGWGDDVISVRGLVVQGNRLVLKYERSPKKPTAPYCNKEDN
jgi:hypothetical protein